MLKEITSIKHPCITLARELCTLRGRLQHHKALLFDLEQLQWACKAKLKIEFIITLKQDTLLEHIRKSLLFTPKTTGLKGSLSSLSGTEFYYTSEAILKKATETSYLIPIIAVVDVAHLLLLGKATDLLSGVAPGVAADFAVIFDQVADVGNIGNIIRTANSFGVQQFYATSALDAFSRKTIDTSRGQVFLSNFATFNSAIATVDELKKQGYCLVATSPHAKMLQSHLQLSAKKVALIIGNETNGISQYVLDQADYCVKIPTKIESVNVSVAAGISLYELTFKHTLMNLFDKLNSTLSYNILQVAERIAILFKANIQMNLNHAGSEEGAEAGISFEHVKLLMFMHQESAKSRGGEEDANTSQFALNKNPAFEEKLLQQLKLQGLVDANNTVTFEGKKLLAECYAELQNLNQKLSSKLSCSEQQNLLQLLIKMS